MINEHLNQIGKVLDSYLSNYDNILIIGDFNSGVTESSMHEFYSISDRNSLYKESTCYKNSEKLSCINFNLKFP